MKWMKRVVLALLLVGIAVLLVWSMLPRPVPVEVTTVKRGLLRVTVDEDGRARVEDRYVVTAPLAGTLARIELRAGDAVAAGDVVARIAPLPAPLLDARSRVELTGRVGVARAQRRQADATVARAETAAAFAEREVTRIRGLVQHDAISPVELERAQLAAEVAARDVESARFAATVAAHELTTAEAAAARLAGGAATGAVEDVDLRAPVSGRVLRRLTESEGVVGPGTPLLELGDPSRLEIVVDVLTADAVAIRPGAPATIERWGGAPLTGKVRTVEPSATTRVSALGVEEQRVDVIVDLVDPPAAWSALGDGWRVEARIVTAEVPDALIVPIGALFRDGEAGWAAYVADGDRARLRHVELGARASGEAAVTAGLSEGDRLILHPGERVKDGVAIAARRGRE
ncbi:MAG: efflux RND transporter periplasmic adaptor subunit [Kofleriaceae bacterium]|nr:efflux RND transporter periplasmic adaptor subunit [Kofleriaceae bacterium]MCB9573020.1 efflux RND transporter periplasmic adaptor subunit [Kofleriaceae bacterium]